MLLFAAMGVARWLLLRRAEGARETRLAELPSVLALVCLLYPLYTAGLQNDRVGLIGTIVTLAFAIPVAVLAARRSAVAGSFLAAVCVWLAYAATVTGLALR